MPQISESEIHQIIMAAKVSKSSVPWDLPTKLLKSIAHKILAPTAKIFNNITRTGTWPNRWKEEDGRALKKTPPNEDPQSIDQVRIISLTPFLSKTYEQILMNWIIEEIGDQIYAR